MIHILFDQRWMPASTHSTQQEQELSCNAEHEAKVCSTSPSVTALNSIFMQIAWLVHMHHLRERHSAWPWTFRPLCEARRSSQNGTKSAGSPPPLASPTRYKNSPLPHTIANIKPTSSSSAHKPTLKQLETWTRLALEVSRRKKLRAPPGVKAAPAPL
jgi:hypothetical protein